MYWKSADLDVVRVGSKDITERWRVAAEFGQVMVGRVQEGLTHGGLTSNGQHAGPAAVPRGSSGPLQ